MWCVVNLADNWSHTTMTQTAPSTTDCIQGCNLPWLRIRWRTITCIIARCTFTRCAVRVRKWSSWNEDEVPTYPGKTTGKGKCPYWVRPLVLLFAHYVAIFTFNREKQKMIAKKLVNMFPNKATSSVCRSFKLNFFDKLLRTRLFGKSIKSTLPNKLILVRR